MSASIYGTVISTSYYSDGLPSTSRFPLCIEADQGQFDAWEVRLTLMDYESRRAQQMLRDKRTLPTMLFGSGAIHTPQVFCAGSD